MLAPLNSLSKDWNTGRKRGKNTGLKGIIAAQLLKSINLVPLQKTVFLRWSEDLWFVSVNISGERKRYTVKRKTNVN